jgi:hypothetical protein
VNTHAHCDNSCSMFSSRYTSGREVPTQLCHRFILLQFCFDTLYTFTELLHHCHVIMLFVMVLETLLRFNCMSLCG